MELDFFSFAYAIVNFIVLVVVMYFVMYKPLAKTMKKRQDTIKGNIESAEALKAEAEAIKAEISAELAKSRETAQEIIARAEKSAEAQKIKDKAQAEIQDEKEKVLGEIRNEAATLALLAASKLIDRSLTDADHKQLVDKYIQEAGELQ